MNETSWTPAARAALLTIVCAALAACGGGKSDTAVADPAVADSAESLALKRVGPVKNEAPGRGYFVDAVAGSDANPGSFALPWKSLAMLTSVRLATGEGLWFKCGSVWRESLVLGATQLVDGATLTAYGSCTGANKPRVSGADDVSGGWTRSGNVWSRAVSAGWAKVPKVFVNGQALRLAQWPNFGGIGREYALTAAGAGAATTSIQLSVADRAALAGKDVAGATAQVRSEPWLIEQLSVDALDATGLKLRAAAAHPVNGGDGFVLQGKAWMLDAPGEFFHDAVAGMLYVIAPDDATGANFNAAQVEAVVRDVGVVLSGRSGVTVSNLAADMARTDGFTLNGLPGATLVGVDASNNVVAGVRVNLTTDPVAPARGAVIKASRFANNGHTGIDAGNGQGVDILSNTVSGTGMGQANWSSAGVVAGDGGVVDGNAISDSAFRGVLFSGFKGTRVSNNLMSSYCMRLSDCAALYTVNSSNRNSDPQTSLVEGNRVLGGAVNVDGTVGGQILAGVYLDDLSRGVTVRSNLMQGMPIGIFVHNSSSNVVESNRVWLTTDVGLMAVMDHLDTDLMTGNAFRNNQLVPTASAAGTFPALPQITASRAIRFLHAIHGTNALGASTNLFSGNRFVAFNGDFGGVVDVGTRSATLRLSAADWTALNPAEPAPAPPATYAVYKSTLGPELITGGGFDAGMGAWTSYFAPVAIIGSVDVVSNISACDGACARLTSGLLGDRLSSPNFRMQAGAQYMITFKAVFGGKGDIAHPNIARPVWPNESYIDGQGLQSRNSTLSGNAGETIGYEAFFTANSGDEARINLRVQTAGVPVAFDSVSLRQVTGYTISNFGDWGAVIAAPTDSQVKVGCAELGWAADCTAIDVDGNAVALPLTVTPGSSRLLLWSNSAWRI